MNRHVIISCEHAGNDIPAEYRHLFEGQETVLETHRGLDIGALELAQTLSERLGIEPHVNKMSRLLIDLNRSLHHPFLFSEFMYDVSGEKREEIIDQYYRPYRTALEKDIEVARAAGQTVVHISVHTFTPVLNDNVRTVDVGFLYDPKRAAEKAFCQKWRNELEIQMPDLNCRMNAPYRGTADGLTTALRKKFAGESYCGIELEVNQKFVQEKEQWDETRSVIVRSLKERIQD